MADRAWVENARHFFSAFGPRGIKDPLLAEDSIKMVDGVYLDFCRDLDLDPELQKHKRLFFTAAYVGFRLADNRFRNYLKEKNEEAQAGMTMKGMV